MSYQSPFGGEVEPIKQASSAEQKAADFMQQLAAFKPNRITTATEEADISKACQATRVFNFSVLVNTIQSEIDSGQCLVTPELEAELKAIQQANDWVIQLAALKARAIAANATLVLFVLDNPDAPPKDYTENMFAFLAMLGVIKTQLAIAECFLTPELENELLASAELAHEAMIINNINPKTYPELSKFDFPQANVNFQTT